MRLLQLCRRKYVVFLLVLITTVSVLWTFWIGSRLQGEPEIPVEGFQSMTNRITHQNLDVLRINRGSVKEDNLTRKKESQWYSISRKSKMADESADRGLLQRLQEVINVYWTLYFSCNTIAKRELSS